MSVKCSIRKLGSREFFVIDGLGLPIDAIKKIETENVSNGGCENSVRITMNDDNNEYVWAYENADMIRNFFNGLGINNLDSPFEALKSGA